MNTPHTPAAVAATIDPVTVEIIRNGLYAVTEEMKTNLMRTAYNLIIYEALDFTVGLFTKEGDTVSIGLGLPMFIRGMSETVKSKIRHFGYENIHPGDILVTNDAYTTGSHLNHFTFTMPVFHEGELIGFTCCMAHWLDVGGSLGQITAITTAITTGIATGIACALVAYKRLTTPTDFPVNDGSFRPLKAVMPMGTVISAERVQFLNKAFNDAVSQLAKAGAFEPLGIEPVVESVEDFRKYMAGYITESADLLKGAGFKPE